MDLITVSAVVLRDAAGLVLTVRKRGRTTHLRVTGEACQFGAATPSAPPSTE